MARTLTVTTANAQFDNAVSGLVASISVAGTSAINTTTMTTTLAQTYTGAVTLGADVNFTGGSGSLIRFQNRRQHRTISIRVWLWMQRLPN